MATESSLLLQRYERAADNTAPRMAAHSSGVALEGYWLEAQYYFFLAEKFDAQVNVVTRTPFLFDCKTGQSQQVASLEAIVAVVNQHSSRELTTGDLATAVIDMPDTETLAVTIEGLDILMDRTTLAVKRVGASLGATALYSPDFRHACLVRGHDLWIKDRLSGEERRLTFDGEPLFPYGQRAESGLAAVSYRKQPVPDGLWSADSRWLLTRRIDERELPELALVEHRPKNGGRPVLHTFKYPMPGDPLPTAIYVAINLETGERVEFSDQRVPVVAPWYPIGQAAWFGSEDTAWILKLDRYFKKAELVELDLGSGTSRTVITEEAASGYLELHSMSGLAPLVRVLASTQEILWYSERSGWGHLYLYDSQSGRMKSAVSVGEWCVRDIVHVDERRRRVLILASGLNPDADPARRSLCSVDLDTSSVRVLSEGDGDVLVPATEPCGAAQSRPFRNSFLPPGVSPDAHYAVQRLGNVSGNRFELMNLVTGEKSLLAKALAGKDDVQVRHFTAVAADGRTRLHGVLFLPPDFAAEQRYPLIDYVYPGPQITFQPQSYRSLNSTLARSLSSLGFITLMLDSRCTPIGSRSFRQSGYGELLATQLADHAAVVRQLCAQFESIDSTRIGIVGASGGGAAAFRALAEYGELYKAAVSVCGNHDSTHYTASWSDKYRGPPPSDGWAKQSNLEFAKDIQGKVLLVTGDMDENVPLSQTLSLVDALISANKDFDLLIVPGAGHPVTVTSGYAQRRIWDFFVKELLGAVPPRNFELRFSSREIERLYLLGAHAM